MKNFQSFFKVYLKAHNPKQKKDEVYKKYFTSWDVFYKNFSKSILKMDIYSLLAIQMFL